MQKYLSFTIMAFAIFSSGLFGDTFSLEKLIAYGLEHSTAVQKSKAQTALARAQRDESRAGHLGSIDLVGSYMHYNLPRTLAPLTPASILSDPAGVPTTTDLFTTGIMYTVPLFTGFAQTSQVEMDSIATELSENRLALTKEQLAYNVASLYLSILSLQEMLQAQRQHVDALKQLTDVVKKEVALGKKAQIDLLKAQNDFYGNLAYETVIKGNITMTKAALAALVGLKHIEEIQPVDVTIEEPKYTIEDLLNNADTLKKVRMAELEIEKAEKMVEKSRSQYYPQIALNSYYGYNYGYNDSSNKYPGDFNSQETWQIGVSAKWSLFDFGKSGAAVQKTKIAGLEADLKKQQTLLDLRKSLTEAYEKMKQAYAEYQANIKQYTLVKESEKIESVRYQSGVATINDLLYAKSQTHLVEAKRIQSKYNYKKEKYYMDYLLEKGVEK